MEKINKESKKDLKEQDDTEVENCIINKLNYD